MSSTQESPMMNISHHPTHPAPQLVTELPYTASTATDMEEIQSKESMMMVIMTSSPAVAAKEVAATTLVDGSKNASKNTASAHTTSIPPLGEFAHDLEHMLGRANGNVYHRREGMPDVHDGQVMVRLKKKRFVILDYSIIPTDADRTLATTFPHVKIPRGAGRELCKTPQCSKIGIPVCIYDSEPHETDSLYLRTGLCFTCQRNLNEKRRTERKRPNIKSLGEGGDVSVGEDGLPASLIYAMGPERKKFRYPNGTILQLNSNAIIVNGSVEGTKHYSEGYGLPEIGHDLIHHAREGCDDIERLVQAVSTSAATAAAAVVAAVVGDTAATDLESTSIIISDSVAAAATANNSMSPIFADQSTMATSVAAAVDVAVEMALHGTQGVLRQRDQNQEEEDERDHLDHPHDGQQGKPNQHDTSAVASTDDDINVLYQRAFLSLNRAIFLLTQWKSSWDATIDAAQETVTDPSLADAVASAAAVAAARVGVTTTAAPTIMTATTATATNTTIATGCEDGNDDSDNGGDCDHNDDDNEELLPSNTASTWQATRTAMEGTGVLTR